MTTIIVHRYYSTFIVVVAVILSLAGKAAAGSRHCIYNGERVEENAKKEFPDYCMHLRCKYNAVTQGSRLNLVAERGCTCVTVDRKKRSVENGTLEHFTIKRKRRRAGRAKRDASSVKCRFNDRKFDDGEAIMVNNKLCLQVMCRVTNNRGVVTFEKTSASCECNRANSGSGGDPSGSSCSSTYSSFTSDHSMCKPKNENCGIISEGVLDQEKEEILRIHNTMRNEVANGNEAQGDPGPQPSAAYMREMVWNDELAQVAQAWANTCPTYHDCYDCRKISGNSYVVGQNMCSMYGQPGPQWASCIQLWYDEVADMDKNIVSSFQLPDSATIGHYTQIVWGDTYEIGCGAVYSSSCVLSNGDTYNNCLTYVCNYGPAGNFINSPVYEEGDTNSNCNSGFESTTYDGLCQHTIGL